ncbi:hypothetical protein [Shewanella sp. GXUN23E]|uniref:hypothetical protein n=1 Tax=Shewanella sp. GXUN23E TaxID=3422498 RepID=UPI003D7C570E
MKISSLSWSSSGLLLMLAAGLAVTSFWGHRQWEIQQLQANQLQQEEQMFLAGIRPAIAGYLASGDAGKLQLAHEQLSELQQTLPGQSGEEYTALQTEITTLQSRLTGSVRDAGKLSAEPRALLANAERELLDLNRRLQSYALQGISTYPEKAAVILDICSALPAILYQSAQLSQHYLIDSQPQSQQALENVVSQQQSWGEKLQQSELLGLYYQEESDEFALGNAQPERYEIGENLIAAIVSLLQRYPKEIRNTEQLLNANQAAKQALAASTNAIEQSLLALSSKQRQQFNQRQQQLSLLFTLLNASLFCFALGFLWFQRKHIVLPIAQLRQAFKTLLETGQRQHLQLYNRTETGDIAGYFNRLIDSFNADDESERADSHNSKFFGIHVTH